MAINRRGARHGTSFLLSLSVIVAGVLITPLPVAADPPRSSAVTGDTDITDVEQVWNAIAGLDQQRLNFDLETAANENPSAAPALSMSKADIDRIEADTDATIDTLSRSLDHPRRSPTTRLDQEPAR
ncbi:hypothetical protein ACIBCN_38795 [Nocardia sp. NPDC051052]|uniref:hypothetical protein n=1 Tax=Nocardia sp. NPDC051052 TaxID=3364322 RepID=UPI0037B383BE